MKRILLFALAALACLAQSVIIPSGNDAPTFRFVTGVWGTNQTCPNHQVLIRTYIGGGLCVQLAAADVTSAVDATANYYNPAWLTTLDWSRLTNVPSFAPSNHSHAGVYEPVDLHLVRTTGSYPDPAWLTLTWSGGRITGIPAFAAVATSGDYGDLLNKPSIPAQANADWNAVSGAAQVLNKPTLGTSASHPTTDFAAVNASTTVNGQACSLGSSCAVSAPPSIYLVVFDGATTSLTDGSTVTWSCGSGSGAQCTASWTVPTGVTWVRVTGWAGGGGGGGGSNSYGGYGGGGGGYWQDMCAVTPGAAVAVAVGLGGAGIAGTAGGNHGGTSSFGTCFSVMGGAGGYNQTGYPGYFWGGRRTNTLAVGWTATSASTALVAGNGTCTNGASAYLRKDGGGCAGNRGAATSGAGGDALNGGGGGGGGANNTTSAGTGGAGGVSFGGGGSGGAGGGTTGSAVTACADGAIPGGGGGGAGAFSTSGNTTGCVGARGEVRVYYTR